MPRNKMNAYNVNKLLEDLNCYTIFKFLPLTTIRKHLEKNNLLSQRKRILPAESIVYLLIYMAINANISIIENLKILLNPLKDIVGIRNFKIPVGSAIVKSRKRLQSKVFVDIFKDIAIEPINIPKSELFKGEYQVVAVDGTSINLQDTLSNREYFGIHSKNGKKDYFPQLKATALMDCYSKQFLNVEIGPYDSSERKHLEDLSHSLNTNMVLLADRGFYSCELWDLCKNKAGILIWRIIKNIGNKVVKKLEDGSSLIELNSPLAKKSPHIVRLIEFVPKFSDGTTGEIVRLITNILDPSKLSASEVMEVYPERWLIEEGFSELKNHLCNKDKILRSQDYQLVIQEFYGFLIAHSIIRKLICTSVENSNIPPNHISFLGSLNLVSRTLIFFPSDIR